ncbi:MAG: hypothetical protein ABI162_01850 [Luteolibacter sp.]
MRHRTSKAPKSVSPAKSKMLRARSLPSRKPFDVAVAFSMAHYLAIVTTVTAFVCYFISPSQKASKFIVAGIIFSAFTWLFAFFKRRATHCPLCKGTPLINSGALTHTKAVRLYPFNHGVTSTLSIIATQRFRCMYCGSDFDLLKPPSHLLVNGKAGDDAAK